ncbi:hypothetical protein CDV55_106074 [Aspergillus turcosus]|uniref:Protein kinase domain-containing protein n=1 Tax=Aspergillus turcosus TaxID=1245748 RepID=A0A397H252_9EURO|nr:hypothetical protein CDV55_106074 [Aspergillus turcosus]RLL93604.1 hypothetical protein CFD26_102807 [Aspergillus turcosus]
MPIYIYTECDYEIVPPMPEWGSLPLDIYLLEQWDAPYPENKTAEEHRRRLVRQFIGLGVPGREPYHQRAQSAPLQPTESQIETILRPLRPDSLRRYAAYVGSEEEGLWLRTCYDPEKEDTHKSLFNDFAYHNDAIGYHSLVPDDKELFVDLDVAGLLEIFPERVTNEREIENTEKRERELLEIFEREEEDEISLSDLELDPAVFAWHYWFYHAACVVIHLFVEDKKALDDWKVLDVPLDDCGNVVRQFRQDEQSASCDGSWYSGGWKELFRWAGDIREIGPAYLPGGVRVLSQGYSKIRVQSLPTRAPEVWQGLGCFHSSDVWSFGVTGPIFGAKDKIVENLTEAWCIAKIRRLVGPIGPPISNRDYEEEFLIAEHLESSTFTHPDTGLETPFIEVGSLREELEKLPGPKISPELLDLIEFLLVVDHRKRPTAAEALQHPYLQSLEVAEYNITSISLTYNTF